jgi:hypothetical protein
MTYRILWKLVGHSDRLLDSGNIDEDFEDYGDAIAAISSFLRSYPEVARHDAESYWRARRSSDADLELWVWVENDAGPCAALSRGASSGAIPQRTHASSG